MAEMHVNKYKSNIYNCPGTYGFCQVEQCCHALHRDSCVVFGHHTNILQSNIFTGWSIQVYYH